MTRKPPTLAEARILIASLSTGDTVILYRDGQPLTLTVQRRRSSEPGGFGHPDGAAVTVGYGPGRFNTEVTAAGIAYGNYALERVA